MFTTKSKSGASCLSRCLIYKVHTALSGGSLSYHTVFVLSRTFFRFFNLFSFSQTPRRAAPYFARRLSRRLSYCSTSCPLCQELFSGIFVLFSFPHSEPQFRSVLPSVGQLRYVTTPTPDCQALFSTFSRFSFCPLQPDILPQNSLLHNHLSYDTLILS